MQIIQFPISINNNTMTSNAMSMDVNTSKETINTLYIKSMLAQNIMKASMYNALGFYATGTLKFNHKVLQHIRKFISIFPDTQFNGKMQLHYYIKIEKSRSPINIVIYGVSFTDNNDNIVLDRSKTVINVPTIPLAILQTDYSHIKVDFNMKGKLETFMKIHINTNTLYYMPNLLRVTDYATSTTYKGHTQTVLYLEDGTYAMLYNNTNEQIYTLLDAYI